MGKTFFCFLKFSARISAVKLSPKRPSEHKQVSSKQRAVNVTVENITIYMFSVTSNYFYLLKLGSKINWWSNVLSQAQRLGACVCGGRIMWVLGGKWHPASAPHTHPPTHTHTHTHPPPSILPSRPSIHPSTAPFLPIWLCPLLLGLPPSWQLACWAADTYPGIRGFTDTTDQTSTSFSNEMNV